MFELAGEDDPDHPPGQTIMDRLQEAIDRIDGIRVVATESWRDAGWHTIIELEGARFEFIVSQTAEADVWLLQVACRSDAGLVRRWLGSPFVDRSETVYRLATIAHDRLQEIGATRMAWKLDGVPRGDGDPSEPIAPQTNSPA